ncbi:uncharacterized protein LOC129591466 [Paramacrobiotus metropolitanus]|uniref:uncharacterized protein LOC129591466 n=1 Tax=Paramacrobiotus metropolitanus TaxID=2943436 RepID=UPI00244586C8|nr:uncharacterized protein LOC129591466 [Paramacrobiotus metropolitanus]
MCSREELDFKLRQALEQVREEVRRVQDEQKHRLRAMEEMMQCRSEEERRRTDASLCALREQIAGFKSCAELVPGGNSGFTRLAEKYPEELVQACKEHQIGRA